MPDLRLDDGKRLFDHLRGPQATQLTLSEGSQILIRPDGYIACIGASDITQYAGEPIRYVQGCPVLAAALSSV